MKRWSDYTDSYGLIVTREGDGGDSCNRTFSTVFLRSLNGENVKDQLDTALVALQPREGLFIRSPHPGKWYSHTDRLSRDQLIPVIVALGACRRKRSLFKLFKRHARRLWLFTWNTKKNFQYPTLEEHLEKSTPDVEWDYRSKLPDFCGPEVWALYVRGLDLPFRPLLWLGDMETLINSVLLRFVQKDKKDVINHTLVVNYATRRRPTLIIHAAMRVFNNERLLERLDRFFGEENEPPINELARQALGGSSER